MAILIGNRPGEPANLDTLQAERIAAAMGRVCDLTGAKPSGGNKVRYRGKAKYLGGIGKKVTSITPRSWSPNLQRVTAVIDGKPTKVRVTARAIKSGLIVKPLKRKYGYSAQQKKG